MLSTEIRDRYLTFFEKRGHVIVPSASLLPKKYESPDEGTLCTAAGMQPLIPYLLGHKHPAGTKIVDVQKCVRNCYFFFKYFLTCNSLKKFFII